MHVAIGLSPTTPVEDDSCPVLVPSTKLKFGFQYLEHVMKDFEEDIRDSVMNAIEEDSPDTVDILDEEDDPADVSLLIFYQLLHHLATLHPVPLIWISLILQTWQLWSIYRSISILPLS